MDTEVKITAGNLQAEIDLLWPVVCAALGVDQEIIRKPKVIIIAEELGTQTERTGKVVGIVSGAYRIELAHELGHAAAIQFQGVLCGSYEVWGLMAEEAVRRA